MKNRIFIALLPIMLLSSCKLESKNVDIAYLNHRYILGNVGYIANDNMYASLSLKDFPGYVSYKNYFNFNDSFLNFECYRKGKAEIECRTTIYIVDKKGNAIIDYRDSNYFHTHFSGGRGLGEIIFEEEQQKNEIGRMQVYVPYSCRCQFDYKIQETDESVRLTFDFAKREFNDTLDLEDVYEEEE